LKEKLERVEEEKKTQEEKLEEEKKDSGFELATSRRAEDRAAAEV